MIRRPPRSTPLYSSAASDVYKRQVYMVVLIGQQNLDYLFRVLIQQLIGLCRLFDRKTVRDEPGRFKLADHLPRDLKTTHLCPSTIKFWRHATDLAADHANTAAMEAST